MQDCWNIDGHVVYIKLVDPLGGSVLVQWKIQTLR